MSSTRKNWTIHLTRCDLLTPLRGKTPQGLLTSPTSIIDVGVNKPCGPPFFTKASTCKSKERCPFTMQGVQHPFITGLNSDNGAKPFPPRRVLEPSFPPPHSESPLLQFFINNFIITSLIMISIFIFEGRRGIGWCHIIRWDRCLRSGCDQGRIPQEQHGHPAQGAYRRGTDLWQRMAGTFPFLYRDIWSLIGYVTYGLHVSPESRSRHVFLKSFRQYANSR